VAYWFERLTLNADRPAIGSMHGVVRSFVSRPVDFPAALMRIPMSPDAQTFAAGGKL
jgi:hypothetical protein